MLTRSREEVAHAAKPREKSYMPRKSVSSAVTCSGAEAEKLAEQLRPVRGVSGYLRQRSFLVVVSNFASQVSFFHCLRAFLHSFEFFSV